MKKRSNAHREHRFGQECHPSHSETHGKLACLFLFFSLRIRFLTLYIMVHLKIYCLKLIQTHVYHIFANRLIENGRERNLNDFFLKKNIQNK